MNFRSYDLGRQERGATAVINLRGNSANVRLMDAGNFRSYKGGSSHRYIGGLVERSPVRLTIPSSGRWYVTVDLQGLAGSVRSSVQIEPPALPRLKAASSASSLNQIHHEPSPELARTQLWDVFISHASEDKAVVATPLAEYLRDAGLEVWLDTFELKLGDSLRRKIDAGLSGSRFGVVVLSRSFFKKGWPQYELDGLVTRHVSGQQSLLPIWHNITRDEVIAESPSLADKIARSTAQYTIEEIASEIIDLVQPSDDSPVIQVG